MAALGTSRQQITRPFLLPADLNHRTEQPVESVLAHRFLAQHLVGQIDDVVLVSRRPAPGGAYPSDSTVRGGSAARRPVGKWSRAAAIWAGVSDQRAL